MKSHSGFVPILIAIAIALVAVLIGGGYIVYKNRSQPQPTGNTSLQTTTQNQNSANTATQNSNSQPQISDISTWKTYRNEKYGFEVKYPSDWYLVSEYPRVSFATTRGDVYPPEKGASVDVTLTPCEEECKNSEGVSINGPVAQLFGIHHILNNNAGIPYMASLEFWVGDKRESDYRKIFKQLLSTFIFVDRIINTSNWKTYRNEKYGFEIKYPSIWHVEEDYSRAASNFTFTSPVANGVQKSFLISSSPDYFSTLDQAVDESAAPMYPPLKKEPITVNGYQAILVITKSINSGNQLTLHQTGIYVLHDHSLFGLPIDAYHSLDEEIYNVFSTFTFTK